MALFQSYVAPGGHFFCPIDLTLSQVAAIVTAGTSLKVVNGNATGAIPIIQVDAPGATDVAIVIPQEIPVRKGDSIYSAGSAGCLMTFRS